MTTKHSIYKTIKTPFGNFAITPKDYDDEWKEGGRRRSEGYVREFWLVFIGELGEMPVHENTVYGGQSLDSKAFTEYADEHGEKTVSFMRSALYYVINRVSYKTELELVMIRRESDGTYEPLSVSSTYSTDTPLTAAAKNKLLASVGYQATQAMQDEKWLAWIDLQYRAREEVSTQRTNKKAQAVAEEALEAYTEAVDAYGKARELFETMPDNA